MVTWRSSDTAVATVVDGVVSGNKPGDATITATVQNISASTIAHVAWRSGTHLSIATGPITAEIGDRLVLTPHATGELPASKVDWESTRPDIARVDAPGIVSALAVGTATIVGRVAGLVDSVRVTVTTVADDGGGFGYFYSADAADPEGYSDTDWAPLAGNGYSTAGIVGATWEPPYPSHPNLGWIGPSRAAHGAVLHVVSLDNMNCTAYPQPTTMYQFVALGAPLIDCHDKAGTLGSQSPRMEFVAFRAGEFDGRIALVRPDGSLLARGNASISAVSPGIAPGEFAVTGIARDSLYWFASPGSERLAACATVPMSDVASSSAVRVTCSAARNMLTDPLAYLIGFGPDARHGAAPIGFLELGADGAIKRASTSGLDVTVDGSNLARLMITVAGDQVAVIKRLPALLVTAIGRTPSSCSIDGAARTLATVQFLISCPNAAGVTLGVIY